MPYQITEPHPTALPNHYIHCGRGGAGNTYKTPSVTNPITKSPSNTSSHQQSASSKTSTGRGGAGNIHSSSELPLFSFSEEIDALAGREGHHDVWHVGRGGAGNWSMKEAKSGAGRKLSSESAESSGSSRSGVWGRVSGAFERR